MTNVGEFPEARPGVGVPFTPPKHPKDVMSPDELIEYYSNLQIETVNNIEE